MQRPGDLERRAALHAALGDPARLAIVEALQTSDRTPGELAEVLDLTSNLLAHHLATLERAGAVRRVRSSGDGRRRYVCLLPAARVLMAQAAPLSRGRALFICTHNSARSQLAAALWKAHTGRAASSAGTHPAERVHPGAVGAASRLGLDLSRARPRVLGTNAPTADVVVTVCDRAREDLHEPEGWLHWSIPDPVGSRARRAFDEAAAELAARIDHVTGRSHEGTRA